MAKELYFPIGTAGLTTLYATVRRESDGFLWNTATPGLEAYNAAHVATGYGIPLTEEGSSGRYSADFPTGITAAGIFSFAAYKMVGASPAWPADGQPVGTQPRFEWGGNAVAVPGDVQTIKGQAVTCAAPVAVLASVGTATTSTAQTADAGAALAALANLFTPAVVSTPTSATSFVVVFAGTAPPASGLVGTWCCLTTAGRAPQKLPILNATPVDSTHVALTFANPGFGAAPLVNDAVAIG